MTKDEMKEVLDEAGIEYAENASAKELKALLPKEDGDDETFDCVDALGNVKRTFSVAVHGEDAGALAASFAKKFKLEVK